MWKVFPCRDLIMFVLWQIWHSFWWQFVAWIFQNINAGKYIWWIPVWSFIVKWSFMFLKSLYILTCYKLLNPVSYCLESCTLLSGVPDFFDRNEILSGGDLSHYQVPHCTVDSRYLAPVGSQNSWARVKWFSRYLALSREGHDSRIQDHRPTLPGVTTIKQYAER